MPRLSQYFHWIEFNVIGLNAKFQIFSQLSYWETSKGRRAWDTLYISNDICISKTILCQELRIGYLRTRGLRVRMREFTSRTRKIKDGQGCYNAGAAITVTIHLITYFHHAIMILVARNPTSTKSLGGLPYYLHTVYYFLWKIVIYIMRKAYYVVHLSLAAKGACIAEQRAKYFCASNETLFNKSFVCVFQQNTTHFDNE